MQYKDRHDAASRLIPFLRKYKNESCILMAIPRGGIPIGYHISMHYHFPLEVVLAKKIGHPWNAELAIGAASLEDVIVDSRHFIPKPYIDMTVKKIRESLVSRYSKLTNNSATNDLKGKTAIIVDDGIATGNTILAAIKLIQKKQPSKIVVASPVAPADTSEKIRQLVHEFICPYQPDNFSGVSLCYQNFSEVTDAEAIQLLHKCNKQQELVQK